MNSNKLPDEEKNEQIFKNMAMTFSIEGITKDIQEILQKKMNYNTRVLRELSDIINSITDSKDNSIKRALLEKAKISAFITDIYEDFKVISGTTNIILSELLKKKKLFDGN
jgi:bacterioferritin (cytochrome b1)